ncbi:hypothetical protein TCDM_09007 [Trypanosoma cruzi Dm28c]|uniref:Uncharacterized protein n=1 Tax=Trypanosoma cruzi Dm28c TaxID=1416333 RepID=V5BB03_TRYCR|nr:hypothetical protein TCDM_09007 [Trypanosoma cruzi Dm28c]
MQCGPHPSRLVVTPVTPSRQVACSKDRHRQRRSVSSLSHWGATPPTPSLAHQHNGGAAATRNCQQRVQEEQQTALQHLRRVCTNK